MKTAITLAMLTVFLFASSATMLNRDYDMFTMKNGLQVIMIKTDNQPIVTIEIAVKNGAYTQSPENCGLSHLYEHMFFKGNKKWRSQEEYAKRIRELGIIYNGMTSNESVRYFFTLPSERISRGLEFMSYAIMEPLFDTIELNKERNVVMNEFKRDFSQPNYIFYQTIEEAMFEKYFYRKNAIGDKDVILNATQQQMKDIKNKFYIPNNSALIIVGDIDFKETKKMVEKYFASWKRGEDPDFNFPAHPMLEKDKHVIMEQPVDVATFSIQYRGPDVDQFTDDTYPLDLLTEMMRMKSFPLYKKLVDSGLVYQFYSGYFTQQDGATYSFTAYLNPDNIDTVKEIFLKEIELMADPSYYTESMLKEAKERSSINFYYNIESTEDFALNLAFWWCIADIDYFMGYLDNINKVKAEDISNVVKKYLKGRNKVYGAMLNEEASKKLDDSWKECEK